MKNNKLGLRHWLRVLVLLLAALTLTYYGKTAGKKPHISRVHGVVCWILPTQNGLTSLLILEDDGNDENFVATGMRLWIQPPLQPELLEFENHARYRGPALVLIGDSLKLGMISALASTVDTGGSLVVIGHSTWPDVITTQSARHLRFERMAADTSQFPWLAPWTGSDADLQLKFVQNPEPPHTLLPLVDLQWHGYRARWWPTIQEALADRVEDSISVGILMQCVPQGEIIPHALNGRVKSLVYCGEFRSDFDSTRIAIQGRDAGAAFVDDLNNGRILAKRLHLKWNPAEQ